MRYLFLLLHKQTSVTFSVNPGPIEMDHISIRPGLTKSVTLFLGHPVGADFRGMLLQKLFGKLDFLFKMVLVSYC